MGELDILDEFEDWYGEDFAPIGLTSERDHAHECSHCGGVWIHASDACEWDGKSSSYITSEATCPECERD